MKCAHIASEAHMLHLGAGGRYLPRIKSAPGFPTAIQCCIRDNILNFFFSITTNVSIPPPMLFSFKNLIILVKRFGIVRVRSKTFTTGIIFKKEIRKMLYVWKKINGILMV